jgi:hypothetical protein
MEKAEKFIRIRKSTKEELDSMGDKNDSYDFIVSELIARKKEVKNNGLPNRKRVKRFP